VVRIHVVLKTQRQAVFKVLDVDGGSQPRLVIVAADILLQIHVELEQVAFGTAPQVHAYKTLAVQLLTYCSVLLAQITVVILLPTFVSPVVHR
jgi:hypothetical protein